MGKLSIIKVPVLHELICHVMVKQKLMTTPNAGEDVEKLNYTLLVR